MPQPPDSYSNPDLTILSDNKARWNTPEFRRHGFQNLHQINRYGITLRSDQVLSLEKEIDFRIGDLPEVRRLTDTEIFCGMVVARGQKVLFEKYANDFGPDQPHSIQSISKMNLNLIIGRLVAEGKLDLDKTVDFYLPEIGSGYASATLQQVMDMDLENDYSEDYSDPQSSSYAHETIIGWRLQGDDCNLNQKDFLPQIQSNDIENHSGYINYKSANSDVLAWIVERVSERPIRDWLIDIVEAAGFEQAMYISTDRSGMPVLDGGACLTARDLARFGLLFARRGAGVRNRQVGDATFIETTRERACLPFAEARSWVYYSNQTCTNRRWLGHSGYGGQFMLANLETGIVCVFFSVLENAGAYDTKYVTPMIKMLSDISENF